MSGLLLHRNEQKPTGPIETWPMMAVLDLLDRGTIDQWAPVIRAIHVDPFGDFTGRLEGVLRRTYLYGTSRLFLTLIAHARGEPEDPASFPRPPEFVP